MAVSETLSIQAWLEHDRSKTDNVPMSVANSSVSKRPIWLVEAACLSMALPPTIQRMQDRVPDGRRRSHRHSRQGARNGLAKLTRHAVPSVLAGTAILENTLGPSQSAEGIVKLPVGEQPGIRGDLGTVEFKLQSTVKNDPKAPPVSLHPSGVPYPPLHVCCNFMILIAESPSRRTEYRRYLGNAGQQ